MQSYVQMKKSIGKLQQVTVVPRKKQWEVVEIHLAFWQSRRVKGVLMLAHHCFSAVLLISHGRLGPGFEVYI